MSACLDERQLYRDAFVSAKSHEAKMEAATRMAAVFMFRNEWAKFHEASYRFALRNNIIQASTKGGPRPRKLTMPQLADYRDKIHQFAQNRKLDYFTEYRMATEFRKLLRECGAREALHIVFNQAQGGYK